MKLGEGCSRATAGTPGDDRGRARTLAHRPQRPYDRRGSAWRLAGSLVQVLHAGKLDRVAGVVVGEMHRCDWPHHGSNDFARLGSVEDVLEERLGTLGVPVLRRLLLGHGKQSAVLPLGVTARLGADRRTPTIDQPALLA